MAEILPLLTGKKGLIVGLANEHSIAWGCARLAHAQGAQLVLSCASDKARNWVQPLADGIASPLHACNVENDGELAALVDAAAQYLGQIDFVIHSIACRSSARFSADWISASSISC